MHRPAPTGRSRARRQTLLSVAKQQRPDDRHDSRFFAGERRRGAVSAACDGRSSTGPGAPHEARQSLALCGRNPPAPTRSYAPFQGVRDLKLQDRALQKACATVSSGGQGTKWSCTIRLRAKLTASRPVFRLRDPQATVRIEAVFDHCSLPAIRKRVSSRWRTSSRPPDADERVDLPQRVRRLSHPATILPERSTALAKRSLGAWPLDLPARTSLDIEIDRRRAAALAICVSETTPSRKRRFRSPRNRAAVDHRLMLVCLLIASRLNSSSPIRSMWATIASRVVEETRGSGLRARDASGARASAARIR